MKAYLTHLLSDIAEACREEQPAPAASPDSLMDVHLDEDDWLEPDPQHTFSYYCGLTKEEFPPARLLTDQQMEDLCRAFSKLMYTWNLVAEIYTAVPIAKKYTLLVSVLEEKVEIPEYGLLTIEFCTTDPPTCPLNEYCTCKEIWDRSESVDEPGEPEE